MFSILKTSYWHQLCQPFSYSFKQTGYLAGCLACCLATNLASCFGQLFTQLFQQLFFRHQLSQLIKPLCSAPPSVDLRRNPVRVSDWQAGPEADIFCGQHPDDGRRPFGGRRTRLHQLPRRQGHHRLCHGRSAHNRLRRRRLLVCESRQWWLQWGEF